MKDESVQPTGCLKHRLARALFTTAIATGRIVGHPCGGGRGGRDGGRPGLPSRIEGVGRPRTEPGFVASLVDLVVPVPDAASLAAARRVREVTGLVVGAATGTNLWGALELAVRMRDQGVRGEMVTVIDDAGERHLRTCHDDAWAQGRGLDRRAYAARPARMLNA